MLLVGKKSAEIKSAIAENLNCPDCKAKNTTRVSIFGSFKHVLHIPFLSGGKYGVSTCEKCNKRFRLNEMPNDLKLAYYELKETVKTPFWHYIGLIVIKVFVLVKIFSKYF